MKKKILSVIMLFAVLLAGMSIPVSAANEENCNLSNLSSNWGTVYTTQFYMSNGGIRFKDGNVHVNSLPYGMKTYTYNICCYNGRIYYSAGPEGSDIEEPVKMYSCNMDGSDNILLADNVSAWSYAFIVDNILYYQEFSSYPGTVQGYNGGIYKINLNDYSWNKIVDGAVWFGHCDGDYAYYKYNGSYYAIDTNGYSVVGMPSSADEYNYDAYVKGNNTYYISGTDMYVKTRNGADSRKICTVPKDSHINNVTQNYIYYSTISYTNKRYYATVNCINRW